MLITERKETIIRLNNKLMDISCNESYINIGAEDLISITFKSEKINDDILKDIMYEMSRISYIGDGIDSHPCLVISFTNTSVTMNGIRQLASIKTIPIVTIVIGGEILFTDDTISILLELCSIENIFYLKVHGSLSDDNINMLRSMYKNKYNEIHKKVISGKKDKFNPSTLPAIFDIILPDGRSLSID